MPRIPSRSSAPVSRIGRRFVTGAVKIVAVLLVALAVTSVLAVVVGFIQYAASNGRGFWLEVSALVLFIVLSYLFGGEIYE